MKRIIVLIAVICNLNMLYAETSTDTVYITMRAEKTGTEGMLRRQQPKRILDKSPIIFFELVNKSKSIDICFEHYNYNPTELAKIREVEPSDFMKTIEKPISFLTTVKAISMDTLFPTWTKAQAIAFRDSMYGKTIFIIDLNNVSICDGVPTISLVEVEVEIPAYY
jgi:hypothetical protein